MYSSAGAIEASDNTWRPIIDSLLYITVMVTFTPGQTVVVVNVPDDSTVESMDMFSTTLTTTESNVIIGVDIASVTILDGDGMSFSVCH